MPLSRRLALAAALLPGLAQAQEYPARAPRLLIGFPPGSAADVAARLIAPPLGVALGQNLIIENRPGAGSNIATEQAARAAPDGYTLLLGSVANTINASLQRDLPFDFARDLAPVAPFVSIPNLLVVHPSVPATNVAELIALARAGQLFFASSGIGTAPHLSGELFNLMTGTRMTHVPYPGSAQAVTDLLAGRVCVMFSPASTVLQHVRAGRLRGLASTGATRTAAAPELPTMIEAGLAGFLSAVWFGLMAPGATPAPIITRLAEAVRIALNTGETRAQLIAQGFDVLDGGPADLARLIAEETTKWARVVEASGARNN
ncbi:tripartite tricarboxylate transporter substrate binding protein [Sediminicoccus sp. KRV36]|uniref:tripartite tricarboxylate transporter substrate binding protein n=1 Tax=Sediminicoccus sp. KRV36 TaxID=3133721 RepID=UPI00200F19B5|nr:tripartite tricarboxylate transporter substrate binding protein [Sediminicoccus rosea]UPY37553.1 tripartite tricarboxylate transporter substrate binding protein [Sediminicoccus rosea]